MAEPKTEVDRRFDRHEEAILTIVEKIFARQEVEDIAKILRGENEEDVEASKADT